MFLQNLKSIVFNDLFFDFLFLLIFTFVAIWDSKFLLIPDFALFLLGITAIFSKKGNLLAAILLFSCFFVIFFFYGGLGFGDVKYAFVLGLIFGFFDGIKVCFVSTLSALIYTAAFYYLWKCKKTYKIVQVKIPYGSFLSMGGILFILRS